MPDGGTIAEAGHLYVVATPIGNLNDVSNRAASLLASCDLIACEDTRTTGILLQRLEIKKQTTAYHEHNEREKAGQLADAIASGQSICLVSDAGTPAISDPGFRLVRECRRRGLPVVPVPGPSAIIAALSASGLPTHSFFYGGFLPPKSAARIRFLEEHRDSSSTVCLYESCHRIVKFVDEILETLGPDRVICVAREVTKRHETFLVGPAASVAERLKTGSTKGEFVLLIAPAGYEL
jgi:16S rRNA (cytidine1402-2'-O)-methyltransferase